MEEKCIHPLSIQKAPTLKEIVGQRLKGLPIDSSIVCVKCKAIISFKKNDWPYQVITIHQCDLEQLHLNFNEYLDKVREEFLDYVKDNEYGFKMSEVSLARYYANSSEYREGKTYSINLRSQNGK